MEDSYDILSEFSSQNNSSYQKGEISISDTLLDFERLRISALTKAAEISPHVKEVTIGPKSPLKKNNLKQEDKAKIVKNNNFTDEDVIVDKIREDLRYTLIMKEYETKLQETSEALFNNLVDKMVQKKADSMRSCLKKQTEECMRRTIELRERKLQMLKDLQDNDNLVVLEKARLDEKRTQALNKEAIENMNRILEEQNKATARFASVTDSYTKVSICYNEITGLLQTDTQAKAICDNYINSIDSVVENINIIMDVCKNGTITDKEVKQAEILALNIENVKEKMLEDLKNLKQKEILQKQEEDEAKQRNENKIKQEAVMEKSQKNTYVTKSVIKNPPMFYSEKNFAYYQELQSFLDMYEKKYNELLNDPNYKKFRFDCKKAVNTPVNAISSVSGMHMRDKFDKLAKLLRGEKVQVLDTYFTATDHPQGLYYCTALLAKKIVLQGDLLVSSKPEAAFPLAAVTVALWSQFPDLGKLLEASFHKQCPYLVPMFLPQKEGQTDKEFYLSRGYTYNDGVVEKQDQFLKRMSGIFRLCCAIWIAQMPRGINASNPHSIRYGWKWLASFINLKPEPDICATLLYDFFSVCGSECLRAYKKQFVKIIKLIGTEYFAILDKIDEGGPKTRLEVFIQSVLKSGRIPPPNGLLNNAW